MKKFILFIAVLFAAISLYSQPQDFVPYHGRRMSPGFSDFCVTEIYAVQAKGSLNISVTFNSTLEPRSVSSENILVNGCQHKNSTFTYNRAGDILSIIMDAAEDFSRRPIVLELKHVRSFNNEPLQKSRYENIILNKRIIYKENQ